MTLKQTAPRARRGGGMRIAFNRQALIDQLTRSDGGLEDILTKSPGDLTEAEVRQIAERRLALPAGTEKETLDRFERAFYDDAYGTDPAEAGDGGGSPAHVPSRGPMFQDLADDGDPGPKTRAALRTAAARLGSAKIEEALALGRFEAALRGLSGGASAEGLRETTSAAFADLFRDPAAVGPQTPTEEGESLQMSVNDLGKVLLGPRGFTALREDGIIGPKTEAALMRVLRAAGPRRLTESMGRNLGFFLFESPKPGRRSLLQSAIRTTPEQNFDII